MKQSHASLFLLFLIATTIPHEAFAVQTEQPLTFTDRLRSLQSNATQSIKSAGLILKQKGTCLINYESCTPRDKLAISTAFGFAMGYGFKFHTLISYVLKKLGVTSGLTPTTTTARIVRDAVIITLVQAFAEETGLTGPLIMSRAAGIPGFFTQGYFSATDKNAWITQTKQLFVQSGRFDKLIFLFIIASEAFTILQEALYAVRYKKAFPLISIARYLKMNAQCIWSESYCRPKESAEMRRLGLYFWLGYLQGRGARAIKSQFFPTKVAGHHLGS